MLFRSGVTYEVQNTWEHLCDLEIPRLLMSLCLPDHMNSALQYIIQVRLSDDSLREQNQMGSLAGAAHLLKCNADALRLTQREQKSLVD